MSSHPPKKPKPIKKPKRMWMGIPVLFVLGACSLNMIHVDAIADSVADINARHDAYVQADESLADVERDIYLRDTELLGRVIEEAQK